MLIDFEVENFLSFKSNTILSMETGQRLKKFKDNTFTKNKFSLLKSSIVFGANGSGKSNLIIAIKVLRDIIIKPTESIDDSLRYMPFKLDENSDIQPTKFSIRFMIADAIYHYHIEYTADVVLLEELSKVQKSGSEDIYFRRIYDSPDSEILPENLLSNREQLRNNKLFLFEGQDRNDKICIDVFTWFKRNLVFESNRKELFKILVTDEESKNLFIKLLNLADFNLVDIKVKESIEDIPKEISSFMAMVAKENDNNVTIPKQVKSIEVYSVYKKYNSRGEFIGFEDIPIEMDSSGTQKMMALALMIINSFHSEKVLILDEFDDSFHLSLAKAILSLINSNSNKNQFVLTSHNLNLLDCRLRVDQIYFTEKKFTGATELFSLFDFNGINGVSRSDISFFKRYLDGLFGAVPDIDTDEIKLLFEGM